MSEFINYYIEYNLEIVAILLVGVAVSVVFEAHKNKYRSYI